MNEYPDARQQQLLDWLKDEYSTTEIVLTPVSGDASFRRYFRFILDQGSLIAVDAPPVLENSLPFVETTRLLEQQGIRVPQIKKLSLSDGFFVLTDFGNHLLLDELNELNADALYSTAIETLLDIQQTPTDSVPPYNSALLQQEMALFTDWYLQKHKQIALNEETLNSLKQTYTLLEQSALEQPTVFVHRDYHSRNLMVLDDQSLGVIDYQDAVAGPITYDLVSLLRDCYIAWPQQRLEKWIEQFLLQRSLTNVSEQQFHRWFDLMGVQRHLKATGIFCRLKYRDNKHAYVGDIPRTLGYVTQVSAKYEELEPLRKLLETIG